MRPVPRSRHLVAVLIFAGVGAATGYLASVDDRLSDSQVNIASAALKRHRPETFQHDPIFGQKRFEDQLWRFHTPAFQGLLELVLVPTKYEDLRLPFRALAGVVTMLYLCGMYAVLYAQCRSWSVSAFVAVLSCRVIETLGGGFWGVGSMESITPPALCLATVPLIVLALIRYSQRRPGERSAAQWRLFLVFGVIGLMGNIHLVTAMNVTIVLLIVYVARQRFSPACLPIAIGCGLCALIGALPYAWYYFGLRSVMGRLQPLPEPAVIYEAFDIGKLVVLYPEVLKSLLHWRLLVGGLVLGAPIAAVLGRSERFRTQNLGVWVSLIVGSLLASFGLQGLSQWIGSRLGTAPPVIDFLQAASLILLPLYVLLGQALTNLFRLLRSHRGLLRLACGALMIGWLVSSDNGRGARYAAADWATSFMKETYRPAYVLRHREQALRRAELAAIAEWARQQPESMYFTDRGEFRVLARRPIVAAPGDFRYFYYLAPGRLETWNERFRKQQKLLAGDTQALTELRDELIKADESLKQIKAWYVIVRANVEPDDAGRLKLEPVPPPREDAWGRQYRLYSVR